MVFVLLIMIHTTLKLIVIAQHNLTPYGTATQSSWLDGGHGHARFAIQPTISNAFSMTICTHTATLSDQPAWWMFQFSFGSAFITEIQLYYRHGAAYRMDGFKLYVTIHQLFHLMVTSVMKILILVFQTSHKLFHVSNLENM
ncbi:uncharacterized protein LOC143083098 [Mytilus galloprovincialis]|uniref:uncharacterized protein LOC143083098 n=1 Tax=Mytilus galloprovincialis TaxID=29158 RepID=UPI003F7B49E2